MTNNEILSSFFDRTFEAQFHSQILEDENYAVPVETIKEYMIALTRLSLATCFNYLDNHPFTSAIHTGEIGSCSALEACTDELCEVLQQEDHQGMTIMEIGRAAIYEKYLRVHHPKSWSRYGNNQVKTAHQLGLTFKHQHRWHLSCYGYAYAYPLLSPKQQKRFLVRALLRNVFYAEILLKLRMESVHINQYMNALSASTQGARSASIARLLQLCLDEMEQEGIKYHDCYLPKYNSRTKTASERMLPGTVTAIDNYTMNDEFFAGGVPLYSVKAACGYFVDHEVPEQEGWLDLSKVGVRTDSDEYFVVHAKGDSMLPKIKDGDLCLFKWYKGESLCDDIVLTQCRDYDEEYESSYTIKRFHLDKWTAGSARTISLQPLNKEKYHPIVLSEDDGMDYKTIGVFVKVL